jgi:hypothetical protein
MNRIIFTLVVIFSAKALAYVPTVESFFRHGANADITSNAAVINFKITPINPFAEKGEQAQGQSLWVKYIFHQSSPGKMKLSQLTYPSSNMADTNANSKLFFTEFSPYMFEQSLEGSERGLFFSLLSSLLLNDGSFMINFLKNRGFNVVLNQEILNLEKKSLLERYRSWLVKTKGGRSTEGEESPLSPASIVERDRVQQIMSQPMYADTDQIKLVRFEGEAAWSIKLEGFEAWLTDEKRELRQVNLKSEIGDIEFSMRDYIKFGGAFLFPRQIIFKNNKDQYYILETLSMRYFTESPQELSSRLKRYEHRSEVRSARELSVRPAIVF